MGVTVEAVPPVAVVYHFNRVPVADKAEATDASQYSIGVSTTGAAGAGLMVTTMADRGPSQAEVFFALT